ncbi:MAG: hypothetical protein CM1200mP14_06790 [Gammaproteobacteria bacterium]|nr:MAG: hypothetical protein CM1200mP14_06790 [Gammaproteobacteria bacterium]
MVRTECLGGIFGSNALNLRVGLKELPPQFPTGTRAEPGLSTTVIDLQEQGDWTGC